MMKFYHLGKKCKFSERVPPPVKTNGTTYHMLIVGVNLTTYFFPLKFVNKLCLSKLFNLFT